MTGSWTAQARSTGRRRVQEVVDASALGLGELTYSVHAEGFWQVHVDAPRVLVERVVRAALGEDLDRAAGSRVLELYSGAGLFTLPLAALVGGAGQVLSLEGDEQAVRDARRTLHDHPAARLAAGRVSPRSVREVDPLELITDGSHLTVRAWCLSARDERSFRLDRILNVELLDATATTHRARRRHGEPRSSRSRTAVLTLAPGGRWLVEQVDAEKIEILPEGAIRAQVRGRDEDWLVGLVLSAGRHIRGVLPRSLALRARGAAQRALALNASVEGS